MERFDDLVSERAALLRRFGVLVGERNQALGQRYEVRLGVVIDGRRFGARRRRSLAHGLPNLALAFSAAHYACRRARSAMLSRDG